MDWLSPSNIVKPHSKFHAQRLIPSVTAAHQRLKRWGDRPGRCHTCESRVVFCHGEKNNAGILISRTDIRTIIKFHVLLDHSPSWRLLSVGFARKTSSCYSQGATKLGFGRRDLPPQCSNALQASSRNVGWLGLGDSCPSTLLPGWPYATSFSFPKMKEPLRGIRFQSPDEIIQATKASLNGPAKDDFHAAFKGLVRRWGKFVRNEGSYVEW